MIDYNILWWTGMVICGLPFTAMLVDIARCLVLLVREYYNYEAFSYRLKKHDYVDMQLLNDATKLSKKRISIARKYNKR